MGLFDRFSRLVRANVSYLVSGAEDLEETLKQVVNDMQVDLVTMRQAVAQAIATQKRTERQVEQAHRSAQSWYDRAQSAMHNGDEESARIALTRRHTYLQTVQSLAEQVTQHTKVVQQMKASMAELETKLADARAKKDMYIARAKAAQSSAHIHARLSQQTGDSYSPDSIFERMEARVLDLEAQAELSSGANTDTIAQQFEQLERQSLISKQLEQIRAEASRKPDA